MNNEIATAVRLTSATDPDGFPCDAAWREAPAICFNADWRGLHAGAGRETDVRLLWTTEYLYLQFAAKYRVITVFPDADTRGWRDHLWDRDVCEVFLQTNVDEPGRYKEFEVAPNGFWIDLDIGDGEKRDLRSGMRRRVRVDESTKCWRAEMALPMRSLTERFDDSAEWRVNFFRVEGAEEPRFYSSWRPTGTAVPNFHVPEAFGRLVFVAGGL